MKKTFSKLKFSAVIVTLLLMFYLPSLAGWLMGRNIQTAVLCSGSIQEYLTADAWLVREEEVMISSAGGRCVRNVSEGDTVPAGFAVVTMIRGNIESLLARLSSIDSEILRLRKSGTGRQDLLDADHARINGEVKNYILQLIAARQAGDIISGAAAKDGINQVLKKKASGLNMPELEDPRIEELKREREQLNDQLLHSTEDRLTRSPGVVSFSTDSLEDLLTPASLQQISPELLQKVEREYDPQRIPYGMVSSGQPFARIARGLDYYLVATFSEPEAARLVQGGFYTVKFNGLDTQVEAEVMNSIPLGAGKTCVVMRTDQALAKTVSLRKIGIEVVLGDFTGLKTARTSLKDLDPQAGTARLGMVEADKVSFVDVEVVGMNTEYAIIRSPAEAEGDRIYLYCIYVSDPTRIEEGQDVDTR